MQVRCKYHTIIDATTNLTATLIFCLAHQWLSVEGSPGRTLYSAAILTTRMLLEFFSKSLQIGLFICLVELHKFLLHDNNKNHRAFFFSSDLALKSTVKCHNTIFYLSYITPMKSNSYVKFWFHSFKNVLQKR